MNLHDVPTESDKLDDLKRQYSNFQRDPSVVVFCPWCMRGNKGGESPCCGFFTEGIERIGREQLASVERQWKEVRLGARRNIVCPYCSTRLIKPGMEYHPSEWPRPMVSPFCCNLLSDAFTAITGRETLNKLKDQKARIEDNVAGVGRN